VLVRLLDEQPQHLVFFVTHGVLRVVGTEQANLGGEAEAFVEFEQPE
jgi:hypothetical protein